MPILEEFIRCSVSLTGCWAFQSILGSEIIYLMNVLSRKVSFIVLVFRSAPLLLWTRKSIYSQNERTVAPSLVQTEVETVTAELKIPQ